MSSTGGIPRALHADLFGVQAVLSLANAIEAQRFVRTTEDITAALLHGPHPDSGRTPAPLPAGLLDAGPVVLAMPWTTGAVRLVQEMLQAGRNVRLLRTNITSAFAGVLASRDTRGTLQLLADGEMVRDARQVSEAMDPAGVWIVPCCHAAVNRGMSRAGTVLGREFHFTMLDVVLASRLGVTLYTVDPDAPTGPVALVADLPTTGSGRLSSDRLDVLYQQRAAVLERVLRESPAHLLSWARLHQNFGDALRNRELRTAATLAGIVKAMQWNVPAIAPQAAGMLDRLGHLETRLRLGDRGAVAGARHTVEA